MKVSLFIVLLQIFRVVIYCNTALRSSNPDTWEGNRAICNFVLISPQSCFRSKGCHEQKATEKISFLNTHNSWTKSPREVRRISHQKQQKADKGVLRSRLWNRLSKIWLSSSSIFQTVSLTIVSKLTFQWKRPTGNHWPCPLVQASPV